MGAHVGHKEVEAIQSPSWAKMTLEENGLGRETQIHCALPFSHCTCKVRMNLVPFVKYGFLVYLDIGQGQFSSVRTVGLTFSMVYKRNRDVPRMNVS